MQELAKTIQSANTIILTTHRECDGDGLGAELAVFHALKKSGKTVRVLNVDATPKKYAFLAPETHLECFEGVHSPLKSTDLCLVFDTNDERMLSSLYATLSRQCKRILFIDHHPTLKEGPQPPQGSVIDTSAASTGEMAYRLIKALNIPLDRDISRALYTSITFDTHLYRFVRNSSTSHKIAAELLEHNIDPDEIHRALFGNQTINKTAFTAKVISQIEYYKEGRVAFLYIHKNDLDKFKVEGEEARDVIDMIMNIDTIESALMMREEGGHKYKISLRSKGLVKLLDIAEELGGGGHPSAAGAYITGNFEQLKSSILKKICDQL